MDALISGNFDNVSDENMDEFLDLSAEAEYASDLTLGDLELKNLMLDQDRMYEKTGITSLLSSKGFIESAMSDDSLSLMGSSESQVYEALIRLLR